MRKMNDSAQWQLIEVILVAGMLFTAMYLVRSANITVYKSIEGENLLEAQGSDVLESLASQPASAAFTAEYGSLLEYYIIEPAPNEFKLAIEGFFSSSDVNFKIILIDMTELKNDQTKTIEDYLNFPFVDSIYWVDEKSCTATRIVVNEDNVYKVVLFLWYNI